MEVPMHWYEFLHVVLKEQSVKKNLKYINF